MKKQLCIGLMVFLVCSFIWEMSGIATQFDKPLFTFVQVTDTHIIHGKSVKNIIKGIESINSLRPQPKFVVVTGDLIHGEKPKESFRLYKNVFFRLRANHYSVYGNHDSTKKLYQDMIGELNYSFNIYPYHFIVLDNIDKSLKYKDTWWCGFSKETTNWLKNHLQSVNKETPIILFCHASIFREPSFWKDFPGDCCNYKPVIKMLEPYNVVAWFQGHAHCNDIERVEGIDYITTICLNNLEYDRNRKIGYRVVSVYKDRVESIFKPIRR